MEGAVIMGCVGVFKEQSYAADTFFLDWEDDDDDDEFDD